MLNSVQIMTIFLAPEETKRVVLLFWLILQVPTMNNSEQQQITYNAMMVVIGRMTVYCITPCLHFCISSLKTEIQTYYTVQSKSQYTVNPLQQDGSQEEAG